MKKLLLLFFVASYSHATTIVPEIRWNQINMNTSGAVVDLYDRNNASIVIGKTDETGDSEDKINSSGLLANYTGKNFSAEGAFTTSHISDNDDSNQNTNFGILNVGKKIENNSFGTSLWHMKTHSGYELNILGLSYIRVINENLHLGGQVQVYDDNYFDVKRKNINFGIGQLFKDLAWEVVMSSRAAEEYDVDGTEGETDQVNEFKANITKQFSKIQLYGSYDSYVTDNKETDDKSTTVNLDFELEYMVTSNFFLGFGLGSSVELDEDGDDSDEDETETVGSSNIQARYKMDQLQVIVTLAKSNNTTEYEDGSDDEEYDDTSTSAILTYFY